ESMIVGAALGFRADPQAQPAGQAGAESVVTGREGEQELPCDLDSIAVLNELPAVFDDDGVEVIQDLPEETLGAGIASHGDPTPGRPKSFFRQHGLDVLDKSRLADPGN